MDAGRVDAVWLMVVLLPGFFSVQIRDFFLPPRRATPMDRLFEVVAFALGNYVVAGAGLLLVRALLGGFHAAWVWPGRGTAAWGLSIAAFAYLLASTSVLMGGVVGWVVGHDVHYRLARTLRLTARSGRDDIWQDVFTDLPDRWHVVHLADGKRLVGAALYYSDRGECPSLFLARASWIEPDGSTRSIEGSGILLTEASGIRMVEFLEGETS